MKQKYIFALFFLVFVVAFVLYNRRRTEEYRLPDFSESSNVCPEDYVLICVTSNLYGISDTTPFPENLPKPCEDDGFTPLCLPNPKHIKPPSLVYRQKS